MSAADSQDAVFTRATVYYGLRERGASHHVARTIADRSLTTMPHACVPDEDHIDGLCYGCDERDCIACRWPLQVTLELGLLDTEALRDAVAGRGPRLGEDGFDETYWSLVNAERWSAESPEAAALAADLAGAREAYALAVYGA